MPFVSQCSIRVISGRRALVWDRLSRGTVIRGSPIFVFGARCALLGLGCQIFKLLYYLIVYGALLVLSFGVRLTRRHTGEYLDPFLNAIHGVDSKLPIPSGLSDLISKNKVPYIIFRNHHSLVTGQSLCLADIEEALDLVCGASYARPRII